MTKIFFLLCMAVLGAVLIAGCDTPAGSFFSGNLTPDAVSIAEVTGSAAPASTRTPIYAISGGKDLRVPSEQCLDLDGGVLLETDDSECDFAFLLPDTAGQDRVQFIPLSYSSFAFSSVFWDLPDQQACSLISGFTSQPQWINATGGYYVCYQTGQGHWGILKVEGMEQNSLVIYWITYPEQVELIAREPARFPVSPTPTIAVKPSRTPAPERVYSMGANMWVRLDEGLDLDDGTIRPVWHAEDDLLVSAGDIGAGGLLLNLQLEPAGNAAIQGGAGFDTAPNLADCTNGTEFQSGPLKIDAVHRYRCYQTSSGRMGYVFIHESSPGVGIRLDWVTWPAIFGRFAEPAAAPAPAKSGIAYELVAPPQLGGVKVYRPGQAVSFTWQLKNTGKTVWNTRHALIFTEGNALGGLEKKWIPYPISPGMIVKLTFNLTMPRVPGTYSAVYWLMDDKGNRIGIGENGSRPLQLVINAGEPGVTLADGQNVLLAPDTCFDLDLGYPAVDDPACDFSVSTSPDTGLLQFISPAAAFDFDSLFSAPPRLGECKSARLSSGRHILDVQNWYVCYKTGEGHYGWLEIRSVNTQSDTAAGLLFDWKTYR